MIFDEPLITSKRTARPAAPRRPARASSAYGVEGRREAGDGAHRDDVGARPERVWPTSHARAAQLAPAFGPERFYDEIQALAPRDEAQRSLKAEALRIGLEIGRAVVAARAEGQLDSLAVHGGADSR